jgi:beta-glucosidase
MPAAEARFPDDFVWGAATAAYQIEGATKEGGRGRSIWDTFAATPGKIQGGDTAEVACDHYHRYAEDVALLGELGLGAYRFSIAWPRVYPQGAGRPNEEGLDFYRRLVDALHAAGVEPYVTLYHWDLPQALQDRGGWGSRDTALRFGEYAHTVARALGGGVHRWITLNEPWVAAFAGHLSGEHAPGARDLGTALRAAHHLLLAHAEGAEAVRAEMGRGDGVGVTLNLSPVEPAGDSTADAEAARRHDGYLNRWFLDPLFRAAYPEDIFEWYGELAPPVEPGDLARIGAPLDFLGVNYYTRAVVRHDSGSPPVQAAEAAPGGGPRTAMGWEVYPEGLRELLLRVQRDYAPTAIYITENGAAYDDALVAGAVADAQRRRYLHEHLLQAHRAIEEGVPLRGYFAWSLLDNFEWAHGYSKRFGLVYVDYPTQTRILKASGRWYAAAARENAIEV